MALEPIDVASRGCRARSGICSRAIAADELPEQPAAAGRSRRRSSRPRPTTSATRDERAARRRRSDAEQRLEAEHRPVARAPHARRRRRAGSRSMTTATPVGLPSPWTGRRRQRRDDVGDREDERDDRGDRDGARPLARRQRLEARADLLVARAAAGVAARSGSGAALAGVRPRAAARRGACGGASVRPRLRLRDATDRPPVERGAQLRARRRRGRRPRRSRARRRSAARRRRRPATLVASIPPIANHGTPARARRRGARARARRRAAGLRRRRVHGADADVVGAARAASTCVGRSASSARRARPAPASARASATAMSSWPTWHAVGAGGAREVGPVVEDEQRAAPRRTARARPRPRRAARRRTRPCRAAGRRRRRPRAPGASTSPSGRPPGAVADEVQARVEARAAVARVGTACSLAARRSALASTPYGSPRARAERALTPTVNS